MRYPPAPFLLIALVFLAAPAARAGSPEDLLENGGIDRSSGADPEAWYACSRPGSGVRFWRDTSDGNPLLAVVSGPQSGESASNNWAQRVGRVPAGRAVRVVARVRTEGNGMANVCVQAWDGPRGTGALIGFASTPVLRGDHGWTMLESRPLIIPGPTASIVVRAALTGEGKACFDDLKLLVVDEAEFSSKRTGDDAPPAPGGAATSGTSTDGTRSHADVEVRLDASLGRAIDGRVARAVAVEADCMIVGYIPGWGHGRVDNIGLSDGGPQRGEGGTRTLLRWGAIPAEDVIPGRRFLVALYAREARSSGPSGPVQAFEILEEWPELTCWRTMPRYADAPCSASTVAPGVGWKLFDVTAAAAAQARGRTSPGVMLRFANEDHTGPEVRTFEFVSREAEGRWAGLRPLLLAVDPKK